MRYHPIITSYTPLPPKWRVIDPEDSMPVTPARYVGKLDESLRTLGAASMYAGGSDLLSLVFSNQAIARDVSSRQLAELITERQSLARRHLADLYEKIEEVSARRPLPLRYAVNAKDREQQLNQLERQIADMEKQKREVQVSLWRDTLELRQSLLTERREYAETRRRMSYLGSLYSSTAPASAPAAASSSSAEGGAGDGAIVV